MTAALVLVLAAAPQIDLVAVWNEVLPVAKVDPKTLQTTAPSYDNCYGGVRIAVDRANLFVSADTHTGPDCEAPERLELTIFTRPGGADPMIVMTSRSSYGTGIAAYALKEGKPVELPDALDSIKPSNLVPKELLRDDPAVKATLGRMNPTYILPQQGTTLIIKLVENDLSKLCKGLEPQPHACAPAALKKASTVRAKWNAKEGRFDPQVTVLQP